MGQVTVTLNGRAYRLECSEGEEAHLIELAEYLGSHVDTMRRKFGQVGDDRLILMASLVMGDELWELRGQVEELKTSLAEARRDKAAAEEAARMMQDELTERVSATAERLELLNTQIIQGGALADAANRR
ncbi:MAG TPA: cell division protein ZapA [Methyloceanibacter sp.]|nr:cell division protein ZapA [Methyloceanibacter sp.]